MSGTSPVTKGVSTKYKYDYALGATPAEVPCGGGYVVVLPNDVHSAQNTLFFSLFIIRSPSSGFTGSLASRRVIEL